MQLPLSIEKLVGVASRNFANGSHDQVSFSLFKSSPLAIFTQRNVKMQKHETSNKTYLPCVPSPLMSDTCTLGAVVADEGKLILNALPNYLFTVSI